ncbi:hypothetical protein Tco_1263080 [Tanacetum coccineum]
MANTVLRRDLLSTGGKGFSFMRVDSACTNGLDAKLELSMPKIDGEYYREGPILIQLVVVEGDMLPAKVTDEILENAS